MMATVEKMMALELSPDPAIRAMYAKPAEPDLVKQTKAESLPQIGRPSLKRKQHTAQDVEAAAAMMATVNVDDPEYITLTQELMHLKFWDKDEPRKRFQVVRIGSTGTGDGSTWQAETVELTTEGAVDLSRHAPCADPSDLSSQIYTNLIPFKLRDDIWSTSWLPPCPDWMTIPQFKAMGAEYETKHAASVAAKAAKKKKETERSDAQRRKEGSRKPPQRSQPRRGR